MRTGIQEDTYPLKGLQDRTWSGTHLWYRETLNLEEEEVVLKGDTV